MVYDMPDGKLSAVQAAAGMSDVVTTLTTATKVWGWFGGLSGLRAMWNGISTYRPGTDPFEALRRCTTHIDPVRCQIFTSCGMVTYQDDRDDAFEGDPVMQTVGLTICALAHECGGVITVDLFVRILAQEAMSAADASIPGPQ